MGKITKTADKVIPRIGIPVIISAAMLLIIGIIIDTRGTSQQNNAYIRVINCIASYPSGVRTQLDIEGCYAKVEQDLHVTLQRYDNNK